MMSILYYPPILFYCIFHFLQRLDMKECSRVCHFFHSITDSNFLISLFRKTCPQLKYKKKFDLSIFQVEEEDFLWDVFNNKIFILHFDSILIYSEEGIFIEKIELTKWQNENN